MTHILHSSGQNFHDITRDLFPLKLARNEYPMPHDVDIIVGVPEGAGWAPIHEMARLMASYLDARIVTPDPSASLTPATKILGRLPRIPGGGRTALVIASDPGQLYAIAQPHLAARRYAGVYGWVIDSFWDDRIPAIATNGTYNTVFVADRDDVHDWRSSGVKNVRVLPWGADVWSKFDEHLAHPKTTDILRVGRQPSAYDDDEHTAELAQQVGITFAGRPPFGVTDQESVEFLQRALADAKFVLAFSTLVSPASYTHPNKEYITGRWTDALAHGVTVVGQVPKTESTREILWDGATVDIDPQDARAGLDAVAQLVSEWTPEQSRNQVRMALQRLDWRHRFTELFQAAGLRSPRLDADLKAMAAELADASPSL